ncbi:MAG: D-sedoheptulose-7-phosphate isomerase [Candidatus Cyclobacteriaceae bacterium M3_2C_046]
MVINELIEHQKVFEAVKAQLQPQIQQAYQLIRNALMTGNKIFFCGNGGSAADAQHLAAEFTGRFRRERRALAGLALTTDTSVLTAIGNDYHFDQVFSRQLEALASPGDVLYAISTSGNSPNVVNAVETAKQMECITIGLSGSGGGKMQAICQLSLSVPSTDTARIQEMHILIGHIICHLIDQTEELVNPVKI